MLDVRFVISDQIAELSQLGLSLGMGKEPLMAGHVTWFCLRPSANEQIIGSVVTSQLENRWTAADLAVILDVLRILAIKTYHQPHQQSNTAQ